MPKGINPMLQKQLYQLMRLNMRLSKKSSSALFFVILLKKLSNNNNFGLQLVQHFLLAFLDCSTSSIVHIHEMIKRRYIADVTAEKAFY